MGLWQKTAYSYVLKVPYIRHNIHNLSMRRAHGLVDLFIDRITEGERVLDLGCGFGDVSRVLIDRKQCKCTLVDVDNFSLNSELEVIICHGKRLAFKDDQFDTVLLIQVLHHCADPKQVLSEAARVSKGKVIIIEDVYNGLWERTRTSLIDGLLNFEFLGRHKNKPVSEWLKLFRRLNLKIISQKEFTTRFLEAFQLREAVFILKEK